MKKKSFGLFICNISIIAIILIPFTFIINVPEARAASVTVDCSGTSGAPTFVDEASLAGDDVTFADTGGDGYCALDESISAASILIEAGVVLNHIAEDANGVTISTTGNFEIESGASINVDEIGCQGDQAQNDGFGPDDSNVCAYQGYGYGVGGATNVGAGGGGYGNAGGAGTEKAGGPLFSKNTDTAFIDPTLHGSSGGNGDGGNPATGGAGGGLVILNITGTLTHNGVVSADGGVGSTSTDYRAGGGGSGGAINITATKILGSGTFSADGGAGGNAINRDGGGGGGGRIAIYYTDDTTRSFSSSDFSVAGGSGPDTAEDGGDGAVYVEDTDSNIVNIFHGHTYSNTDFSETTWTVDSSATAQVCDPSLSTSATPSITATNLTLGGTLSCDTEFDSFNFSASSSFNILDSTSISFNYSGNNVDFNISDADDQTWNSFTFVNGAEGSFTIDDAVSLDLNSSSITSNVNWSSLTGLDLDASTTINASEKGCQDNSSDFDGYGPNDSNVCIYQGYGYGYGYGSNTGAGGGGYGGAGGAGTVKAGGASFGSESNPIFFGASGGTGDAGTDAIGGSGGGLITLAISGIFTHGGTISVDGGDGTSTADTYDAAGGGSGGTINIDAITLSGNGTFSADGGDGVNQTNNDGGGGGGGRVRIGYGVDSSSYLSGLTASGVAAGGLGPDTAIDGSIGTLSSADIHGPSISSALTDDTDADGHIDAIVLTMNEDVASGTIVGSDFTLSDSYSVASASRTADSQITIVVTEIASFDTGVVPTTTIAGSIDDLTSNSTTSGSQASTDGAKPQIYRFQYLDVDADGKIDAFDLDFSENIVDASVLRAADLLITNVGDFTAAVIGGDTEDKASGTIASLRIALGTESTAVDTNEGSSNLAISTQSNFLITDGTNTNNTLGAQSQVTFLDAAGAVITSIAPEHGETNVSKSEEIVVVFSEGISTGSATYTITEDPGGTSDTWSVSNTTLTIAHDQFDGSTDYIFEMTAAPDTTSNALVGAISGVTNPATFSIASSGGVSVSADAPDPEISSGTDDDVTDSITESTAGTGTCEEGLNPGNDIVLSWASNSSVNLVNLYYSTDAGNSYTIIDGPITSTGFYTWTIPADIIGSTLQFKVEGTDLVDIIAVFETESCLLNGADDGSQDDESDSTSEVTEPSNGEIGYSPVTGEVEEISVTELGDYIRSSYFSTVYYLDFDEVTNSIVRRPFMDVQTFFTYQDSFDNVKTVTDATLATIDLSIPMLPNAGVVLMKIQSDSRVYAIGDAGVIRWIATEEIANILYGVNWSQYIIDVQSTLFPRFTRGDDIESSEDIILEEGIMKRRVELTE